MGWQFPIFNKCTHPFLSPSLLHALDVLTPFDPPLYYVKRGKLIDIERTTPPLCEAERGMGGEYTESRDKKEIIIFVLLFKA
jgi:hypothetical protein